ncbi:MAG: hypothetical protein GX342_07330 [Alcaligenaceae bacterium]|jgi:hypothetical protein|nr:hypothetical protein [Alcaligenaceae bacterium]
MMSKYPLSKSHDDRTKRKALLVAKIYAERELISLQAQRVIHDVKPSTIKDNLVDSAIDKLSVSKTSRHLFHYIDRHPTVSWVVAQLLTQSVKRTRSTMWKPLVLGAASWFVKSRTRAKRRAEARDKPLPGPRIRAQSKPIRFIDDEPSGVASSSRQRGRKQPKRRVLRRGR